MFPRNILDLPVAAGNIKLTTMLKVASLWESGGHSNPAAGLKRFPSDTPHKVQRSDRQSTNNGFPPGSPLLS
jgi:hypothetical protein